MKKLFIVSILTLLVSLFIATDVFAGGSDPWLGYEDAWGNYVPGYITNDTWMTPMPYYVEGKAVFYGPYAMDATAEYRGIDYEEEGCLGGVSLMSPIDIGKKAWVNIDGKWYGPYCVVDCAKKGDFYSIVVYREEVIELPFELAVEVGMVSPLNSDYNYKVYDWYKRVTVLVDVDPNTIQLMLEENIIQPITFKDYFLENLEFATGYQPRVIMTSDGLWKEYGEDVYWHPEPLTNVGNYGIMYKIKN